MMKIQYSLSTFLIVTSALGIISSVALPIFFPGPEPIHLDSKLIGRIIEHSETFVPYLADDELRHAIEGSRVSTDILNLGKIKTVKVESWNTSIEPPRIFPLLGNARLHRTTFTCLVEFVDDGGNRRKRTLLVEKTQFEILSREKRMLRTDQGSDNNRFNRSRGLRDS
jgi:hypothetical protein